MTYHVIDLKRENQVAKALLSRPHCCEDHSMINHCIRINSPIGIPVYRMHHMAGGEGGAPI